MARISDGAAAGSRVPTGDADLSALQRAVLLTVLYADLFDYPLREDELYDRLVLRRADRHSVRTSTASLTDRYLSLFEGYVTWKGREHLIDARRRRSESSAHLWETARRYAAWLSRVPFVRMVAVSGSLAVHNAEQGGDVDLFCITESNRLWIARLFIVPMSKCTRVFGGVFPEYMCPNYLVTLDTLEVPDRNLFTAHEVVQAVPLTGAPTHHRFLRSNTWVGRFLPHAARPGAVLESPSPSVGKRVVERLLSGRAGDVLDKAAYSAFRAFYRRRALRSGWPWPKLETAYRRDRYTVPEGGYVEVVRRLFEERLSTRLGKTIHAGELNRLFPPAPSREHPTCYDWDELFHREYGSGLEPGETTAAYSRLST